MGIYRLRYAVQKLRWVFAVTWCCVTIEFIGCYTSLLNVVENVLLLFCQRKHLYPSLQGRHAIVTGANRGLGLEITKALVDSGVHTVLLCRSRRAAERSLNTLYPHDVDRNKMLTVIEVDLSSFQSVRRAIDSIVIHCAERKEKIDFFIGNAGIMAPAEFQTGQDGFEIQMEVNTLSHALIVHLLLENGLLNESPNSRIIAVSSFAHQAFTYVSDNGRLKNTTDEYHPKLAYSRSKWLQILLMQSLAKQIASQYNACATCCSINPGVVDTSMARDYCKNEFPKSIRWLSDPILEYIFLVALRKKRIGASLVLRSLVADPASIHGRYLSMGPLGRITTHSYPKYLRDSPDIWERVIHELINS
jgi:NAD(P)-dependent dehydrogenase (short-subunit alcohol dehydrogenase family)